MLLVRENNQDVNREVNRGDATMFAGRNTIPPSGNNGPFFRNAGGAGAFRG